MTKEDYDQIDPEEMELIDIKWCMASGMRRAQRFMEITGRSCLGTADTKLGFDKSKKAIYHRNSGLSNMNQKQIGEGSSKEKSRALVVIQDYEGYDWSKRDNASFEIRKLYAPFKEAQKAKRWDAERECYFDPQGNPVVDPKKVDFDAVADIFPDRDTFHTRRLPEKDYEANLFKHLKEVFETSLPKVVELRKKKEEEIEKLVEEVKKTAGDADENEQKNDEDQKLKTEESKVPDETEVKILTESSELLNNDQNVDKIEYKCRNCIEMCKACTEKDEKIKTKDIELNKIETVFKTKCKEMLESEEVLKRKIEKLTLKCQDFEKENEILKQKCSAECNDCVQKDNNFQDLQKEYDKMKWSSHRVQEAYDTLKKQVKCMGEILSENLTTTKLYEKKFKEKQQELNKCIDEVAKLKQVLVEKKRLLQNFKVIIVLRTLSNGKSSEAEKELQFRRPSNEEFYAQKKQQQQGKDVSRKTCFKCDQTGHLAHKCPNSKPIDVEKQKSEDVLPKKTECQLKEYRSSLALEEKVVGLCH
ncbi:putative protein tag-278 [Helianthus annuus]|uniref:putative protein tag-278 n=1 Tax=Helianthus annuus TaxID=4232 RepID=UPI000B8F0622|nr:putative protein tag-278 [Helianthus annuus]